MLKQKSNPCKNWSECTAKEPRHCALEGCQNEGLTGKKPYRCEIETYVEEYFGVCPINPENEIKLTFSDLVDLLSGFKDEVITEPFSQGGEKGKDDQHITDETLSAKLRNILSPIYGLADLVLLAGINGDEEVMKAAYKAAQQAFVNKPFIEAVLKEIDTQTTAYKKNTGFHSPEELNAYNKGRQDEQKAIEAWMQKWDGINSDFVELLASKLSKPEAEITEEKEETMLGWLKKYLKSKPIEEIRQEWQSIQDEFPSVSEPIKEQEDKVYITNCQEDIKQVVQKVLDHLHKTVTASIVYEDPYDYSAGIEGAEVDYFAETADEVLQEIGYSKSQPYKELSEGEKKLLSTDEVCDMINKAPNFFDLISKKGDGEKKELKPISEISDEDYIGLAKVMGIRDVESEDVIPFVKLCIEDFLNKKPVVMRADVYLYLQSKGYQLPVYYQTQID